MNNFLSDYWFEFGSLSLLAAILVTLIVLVVNDSISRSSSGEVTAFAAFLQREPVVVRTAIGAIAGVMLSFGLGVSEEQQGAIAFAIVTIAGLVAWRARAHVSPVDAPPENSVR